MVRIVAVVLMSLAAPASDTPTQLAAEVREWRLAAVSNLSPPGTLELSNAVLEYNLYVHPARQALYVMSHYRIRPTKPAGIFGGSVIGYPGCEVVAWFQGNIPHRRLRFFVREPYRSWRTLWLVPRWKWVELNQGSVRWRQEQAVLMRLWRVEQLLDQQGGHSLAF